MERSMVDLTQGIVESVMAAHGELNSHNTLGKNENPIVTFLLEVMGFYAQLLMDVIFQEPNEDGNACRCNVRVENGMQGEEARLLATKVVQLQCSIANVANQLKHHDLNSRTMLHCINQNLSYLVVTPGCRLVADNNVSNFNLWGTCEKAELTKKLKTLHDSWVE